MSSLILTINPDEPLVIGDADAVIKVLDIRGKYVKIRIDADNKLQVNRGSIYIGKKLIPNQDYINMPLIDLWSENPDLMIELLEQTANNLHLENFNYDELPEKAKRIFSMVSCNFYIKIIELFLAKFLYINKLEFNRQSIELFKNDFLQDGVQNENNNNEVEVLEADTYTSEISNDT